MRGKNVATAAFVAFALVWASLACALFSVPSRGALVVGAQLLFGVAAVGCSMLLQLQASASPLPRRNVAK